jgi:ElaB/YqjD/DUF883 family membrane-anchored ribosome-binding protein
LWFDLFKEIEMATVTNQGNMNKIKDTAASVADKAQDMAQKAGSEIAKTASAIGERADTAAESVGTNMKNFAGTIRDNLPDSGYVGTASKTVASGLESAGQYLEDKGLSGIGGDMTEVIKRNPIPAVLIALGVGYLIACSTSRSS